MRRLLKLSGCYEAPRLLALILLETGIVKKAIYFLALMFCLFPYTQIIELETYTQPYALLFSAAAAITAFPVVQARFPRGDLIVLALLALIGSIAFLFYCLPSPESQEIKYLLIYVSPIVFALSGFGIAVEEPKLADRTILFAACAWIGTGVIQATIDPNFLTQFIGEYGESAGVSLASGRGTLGFAPEPTHFGFHIVVLATLAAMVGGRNLLALACLATAVLVARSSSAVLALSLGSVIYLVLFGRWGRLLLVGIAPAYLFLGAILETGVLPGDVRLVALLKEFYYDPWYLITSDASANARLGGIWVGVQEIIRNAFLPAGLDAYEWEAKTAQLLATNPWLIFLSTAGLPSGTLIVIYQLGIFGLAIMAYLHVRLLQGLRSHAETFLMCSVIFVFLSQYMISTPGFGIIFGVAAARRVLAEREDSRHWSRGQPPLATRPALAT